GQCQAQALTARRSEGSGPTIRGFRSDDPRVSVTPGRSAGIVVARAATCPARPYATPPTGPPTASGRFSPMSEHAGAEHDALVEHVRAKAVVHGRVTLASGREADHYVDMRRVTLDAQAAPLLGREMLALTADLSFDAVGGLTLGADPVAAAMLHQAEACG